MDIRYSVKFCGHFYVPNLRYHLKHKKIPSGFLPDSFISPDSLNFLKFN